jgi:hypothetical protein
MISSPADSAQPYRVPSDASFPILPFEPRELRPERTIELLLVERGRLAKTVAGGRNLVWLAGLMLIASVLCALPYGAALDLAGAWRVAALYLGAVAICFPSLHVFSGYIGCRLRLSQNLVIALTTSAVASVFALGFAPIIWFIGVTTAASSMAVSTVSLGLLAAGLLAGLGHVARTFASLMLGWHHRLLLCAWQALVAFVAYRLASFLGLA